MKTTLLIAALAVGIATANAQQPVPRPELLRVAFFVSQDLKQMLDTPIPTDPDVKRPVAVREGERGVMVLPESKLSAAAIAQAGTAVVPVGQLWLRRVVPQCDGKPAKPDQLRQVTIETAPDKSDTAILCALGARKDAKGQLQLLVYGKDKEPLLQVPLKPISAPQDNPIEVGATLEGDVARVTLKFVGKYEASFSVVSE